MSVLFVAGVVLLLVLIIAALIGELIGLKGAIEVERDRTRKAEFERGHADQQRWAAEQALAQHRRRTRLAHLLSR